MKEFLTKLFFVIVEVQVELLKILGRIVKYVFENVSFGKNATRFVTIILIVVAIFKINKGNNTEYAESSKTSIKTETMQPTKSVDLEDYKSAMPIQPSSENTRPYIPPNIVESFPVKVYFLNKSATNVITTFKTSKGLFVNEIVVPGKPAVRRMQLVEGDDIAFGIRTAGDKRPVRYHKIGRYPKVAYVYLGENQLLKTSPEKVPEIMAAQVKKEEVHTKTITIAEMYKDMARKTAKGQ